MRAPEPTSLDMVSCKASGDIVISAGEEVLVSVTCDVVVPVDKCAAYFVPLVHGLEVCVGGDPSIVNNRRESYVCFGNDTTALWLVLKNTSGVGMKFSQGADIADCRLVADSIQGMSNFEKETFEAIDVAADNVSGSSCSAKILSRPLPISLLRLDGMAVWSLFVSDCRSRSCDQVR